MKEETVKNVNEEELRKMFREGIPFKVRVTPESSEKIQKIGFEEGIKWANGCKAVVHIGEPGLYFDSDLEFTFDFDAGTYFDTYGVQEICFVETKEIKEKSFFSSQEEIWKYLVEKEGRKVVMIGDETRVLGFKDGVIHNFYVNGFEGAHYTTFAIPSNWEPYVEKPWYENIPEQGVLCWCSDTGVCKHYSEIKLIVAYTKHKKFRTTTSCDYKMAIPLALEEVEQYILKGE